MRTRAPKLALVAWSVTSIALWGCSREPEVEFVAPAIAAPASPPPPAFPVANVAATKSKEPPPLNPEAGFASSPNEPAATESNSEFKAPFPDRVDLFAPPQRVGGPAVSQGAIDSSVTLVGFVKVDRLRALLSVNGEIATVAEGETQLGIEVISVKPPHVVLQRGRQRWQATLE